MTMAEIARPPATLAKKPKILCVDDEPAVLDGLSMALRRRYEIITAEGGALGLEALKRDPEIKVVISDMRMPGMDGSTFLSRARALVPDTVRLLLTGHTEVSNAISAVNDGQIFRFLTKPCPPPALTQAIDAALDQHRLITVERDLLEQTLQGALKTLTDVLALASPACFGRAERLKKRSSEVAKTLKLEPRWQLEVAATLSQLGFVTLPPEVAEKVSQGEPLNPAEQEMVDRAPALSEQLLGPIPRLEGVREILAIQRQPPRVAVAGNPVDRLAAVLRAVIELDALEVTGMAPGLAIEQLKRTGRHPLDVLTSLDEVIERVGGITEVRELSVGELEVGMVIVDDVKLASGALLVPRGYEVTESFVGRAQNFRPGMVREPIKALVRVG